MQRLNDRATYRWSGDIAQPATTIAGRPARSFEFQAESDLGIARDQWSELELTSGKRMFPIGPMSMFEALNTLGLPVSNLPPDKELIDLLLNAAEIEHGLMVQYMYAAATAGESDIAGYLRRIAIEEMGHFLTVQNLLVSFGSSPHLRSLDWVDTHFFKPFDFKLEAASKFSLAKYCASEMPDLNSPHFDEQQRQDLPQILVDATNSTGGASVEAHRVGLLYMKIYWLLRDSDEPMPEGQVEPWDSFPVDQVAAIVPGVHVSDNLLQADRAVHNGLLEHWERPGRALKIFPVRSRAEALQAIVEVSAQGEGFSSSPNGHFDKFVKAWRSAKLTDPVTSSFTQNPWYREPGAASVTHDGDEITNPLAVAFARLGDRSYEVVVLTIALYLLLPTGAPDSVRRRLANASIECMKQCLATATRNLGELPATLGAPGVPKKCGMPYMRGPLLISDSASAVFTRIEVLKTEVIQIAGQVAMLSDTSQLFIDEAAAVAKAMADYVWPDVAAAGALV
ncbi:hypothetical protein CUN63_12465 [Pseudomonas sp. ACM7]|nr:hypothetical protein CUN63_12465 [Pseudomonas sp. ACM7]